MNQYISVLSFLLTEGQLLDLLQEKEKIVSTSSNFFFNFFLKVDHEKCFILLENKQEVTDFFPFVKISGKRQKQNMEMSP